MKVNVKYVNLAELTPYPSNPRTISEVAMADLCQSISEDPLYFEARPIICSSRTGRLVIIAGEKRFIAANRLGMQEAPVAIIPDLTEEDEQRILFKDNGNFGEWDVEMLYELEEKGWNLDGLKTWGVNVLPSFDLGVEGVDADAFISGVNKENKQLTFVFTNEEYESIDAYIKSNSKENLKNKIIELCQSVEAK